MKNVGKVAVARGHSQGQGVPKISRAPIYGVHCAVICSIAQLLVLFCCRVCAVAAVLLNRHSAYRCIQWSTAAADHTLCWSTELGSEPSCRRHARLPCCY